MASEEKNVLNFENFRSEKLKSKERKTQRVFFEGLLACYLVVASKKLLPISIREVSEEGFSFTLLDPETSIQESNFSIRWYLSDTIYFETQGTILHTHESILDQKLQYGCQVHQDHYAYPTYVQLIKLVQNLSEITQEEKKRIF
jgi:hypothetical protein